MVKNEEIGVLAFKVGALVAILAGVIGSIPALAAFGSWVPLILLLAGLVVGYMNVKDKEVTSFLVAAIALLAAQSGVGAFSNIPVVGGYLVGILQNLAAFVAPAAIVVSLKAVQSMAEGK